MGNVFVHAKGCPLGKNYAPILSVRRYFLVNTHATGFWKVQVSPMIADRVMPWGGIGVEIILD